MNGTFSNFSKLCLSIKLKTDLWNVEKHNYIFFIWLMKNFKDDFTKMHPFNLIYFALPQFLPFLELAMISKLSVEKTWKTNKHGHGKLGQNNYLIGNDFAKVSGRLDKNCRFFTKV